VNREEGRGALVHQRGHRIRVHGEVVPDVREPRSGPGLEDRVKRCVEAEGGGYDFVAGTYPACAERSHQRHCPIAHSDRVRDLMRGGEQFFEEGYLLTLREHSRSQNLENPALFFLSENDLRHRNHGRSRGELVCLAAFGHDGWTRNRVTGFTLPGHCA
jgi:hypothetical protein